ncbi:MAG: C40 family peptidase [Dysgonamonadaceae bacterium]|jgi:cell wall-associated NlpC family hydrolase|nr:C40 family peptidase [Dysgonamonadaceae bacterium]
MKLQRTILFIIFFLSANWPQASFSGDRTVKLTIPLISEEIEEDSLEIEDLVDYAKNFIGVPYKFGGSTPQGFDCSGFTQFVFKQFNYELPRSAAGQGMIGETVAEDDLRPGDLVFFKGNRKSIKIGHVGMIVHVYGKGNFDFIHAYSPKKTGIIIQNINERSQGYLFVRRIVSA